MFLNKYDNMYEGSGRDFFFCTKKEKRSRRGKMQKASKLLGKRTVTGQNSRKLYTKKHRRGNS